MSLYHSSLKTQHIPVFKEHLTSKRDWRFGPVLADIEQMGNLDIPNISL